MSENIVLQNEEENMIIATFNITEANKTIALRNLEGMTEIDWGDGTVNSKLSHEYSLVGEYACRIYGVTTIGFSAFRGCSGLTDIEILDGVTTIGDYAFAYCYDLTSVVIPDSVTSIVSYAFYSCYKLVEVVNKSTHIMVTKGNSSNGYVGYYALAVYNSGDTCTSKLSNDNGYIVYTDGAEKILVGYNGTETDLVLPSYITKINQYAFYSCNSLTSVKIGDSVTTIGSSAFSRCSSLTNVVIPDGVTTIGSSAFYYCSSLTSVVIPDGVTTISPYAFENCAKLTSVVIPDRVTSIGDRAFDECSSLTSVVIPDSVTSIGTGAFAYCRNLTSVVIGDSVTSIGQIAFAYCRNLTYNEYDNAYYLGNESNPYLALIEAKTMDITSCYIHKNTKVIGGGAFNGCDSLTSVEIPDGVSTIDSSAFYECISLTRVFFKNTTPIDTSQVSGSKLSSKTDRIFYVPKTSLEAYRTTWDGVIAAENIQPYEPLITLEGLQLYHDTLKEKYLNSMANKKYVDELAVGILTKEQIDLLF